MYQNILWVFLGGGLGSVLRYGISKNLYPFFENYFLSTLTVNLIGSFLIGLFIGFEIKYILQKPLMMFLVVGFCGGFTTFSTFALENYNLLKSGEYLLAFIYIISSIVVGILAVGFGFFVAKQI